MADIHIHREPRPRPRQGAQDGVEVGRGRRGEVRHGVHRDRGRDERRRRVPRAGVDGRLRVEADAFDLTARLGFLLGAFSGRIEAEIEAQLDKLLPPPTSTGSKDAGEPGRAAPRRAAAEDGAAGAPRAPVAARSTRAALTNHGHQPPRPPRRRRHHPRRRVGDDQGRGQEDRRRARRRPRAQRAAGLRRARRARAPGRLGGRQGLADQQGHPRAGGAGDQRARALAGDAAADGGRRLPLLRRLREARAPLPAQPRGRRGPPRGARTRVARSVGRPQGCREGQDQGRRADRLRALGGNHRHQPRHRVDAAADDAVRGPGEHRHHHDRRRVRSGRGHRQARRRRTRPEPSRRSDARRRSAARSWPVRRCS